MNGVFTELKEALADADRANHRLSEAMFMANDVASGRKTAYMGPNGPKIRIVLKLTAEIFEVPMREFIGTSRRHPALFARNAAALMLRDHVGMKPGPISEVLNIPRHSVVRGFLIKSKFWGKKPDYDEALARLDPAVREALGVDHAAMTYGVRKAAQRVEGSP